MNESKTLTRHILCRCKFDSRKPNLNKKWNNDKCRSECKNSRKRSVCEKNLYLEV